MVWLHLTLATLLVFGAAVHFVLRVRRAHRMAATDIAVWMVGLYFGVGPWAAYIAGGDLTGTSQDMLVTTFGAVALYMVGLGATGWLMSALFKSRDVVAPGVYASRIWTTLAGSTTASVPVVMCFFLAAVGSRIVVGMYYGSFFTSEHYSPDMPEWLGDFMFAGEAFRYGAFVWAAATLVSTPKRRLPALFILLFDFLLMLTSGRRWLIIDASIFLFVYFAFKGLRKSSVLYMVGAGLVVYVAVCAFDRTRYYWTEHWENGSGVARFVSAFKLAISDPDPIGRALYQEGNYRGRPLDTEHFCTLLLKTEERAGYRGTMDGMAVMACVVHAIPYRIYPGKREWAEPEYNIKLFYGLNLKLDMGSSMPAYGIADFGLPGALLIGIALGAVFAAGEMFARVLSPKFPYIGAGIAGVLLANACQVGNTPAVFLANLRNIGVLGILCIALMPFVRASWVAGGSLLAADVSDRNDEVEGTESAPVGEVAF